MIYIPDTSYKCYVVRSEDVIRAYKELPTNNSTIQYRDYYYNSNYYYNDGEQSFSQYTTLPTCLDNSVITDDYYYRSDFDSILVMFFILLIILIYFPYRIISRFCGRWLKI